LYNNKPKTLFVGKSLVYLPICHSTNEVSAELMNTKTLPEGTVVITSHQTAGKGQRGNVWESQPGMNLTFSIILNPHFLKGSGQFSLNISISLAISDVLTSFLGKKVKIKWPNDIFFEDFKIAGILIQNFLKGETIERSVIGIGLNINQEKFSYSQAISMKNIQEGEHNLEKILHLLLERIEIYYLRLKKGELKTLKEDYLKALYWREEEHLFEDSKVFSGIIKGVDEIGRLMIKTDQGDKLFNYKEVKFVK
jgi:BirA family transcriptional regulator, biotin operon repressor / biotin---[acetyl-CoA-carboxylase] ligase